MINIGPSFPNWDQSHQDYDVGPLEDDAYARFEFLRRSADYQRAWRDWMAKLDTARCRPAFDREHLRFGVTRFIDPAEPLKAADHTLVLEAADGNGADFEDRMLLFVRKQLSKKFPWNIEEHLVTIGFGDTPQCDHRSPSESLRSDYLRVLDAQESGLTFKEIVARLNAVPGVRSQEYTTWYKRLEQAHDWQRRALVPWSATADRWHHLVEAWADAEWTIEHAPIPISLHPKLAPIIELLEAEAKLKALGIHLSPRSI